MAMGFANGGIQFQHFVKNEVLGADSQSVLGTSEGINKSTVILNHKVLVCFTLDQQVDVHQRHVLPTPTFRPIAP